MVICPSCFVLCCVVVLYVVGISSFFCVLLFFVLLEMRKSSCDFVSCSMNLWTWKFRLCYSDITETTADYSPNPGIVMRSQSRFIVKVQSRHFFFVGSSLI